MGLVNLIMVLALAQYLYFGTLVGKARGRFQVSAPAVAGNELFERYFRVQMNTLELLVVLLPALWIFAGYWGQNWAALLGVVYLAGRFQYAYSYLADPKKRSVGFGLSITPIMVLLAGSLIGALREAFSS
jgi:uncharacterized membrane protein YecN with MAPEG domain